uniref:Uncharacterized protein n=1 Tax=Strigamia maritima TaxID=126957 RepID=T1J077_STRMM
MKKSKGPEKSAQEEAASNEHFMKYILLDPEYSKEAEDTNPHTDKPHECTDEQDQAGQFFHDHEDINDLFDISPQFAAKNKIETQSDDQPTVCKIFADTSSTQSYEGETVFDNLTQNVPREPSPSIVSPGGDDPFSASIRASEFDRRHDAWIASQETKKALKTVAATTEGNFFPNREQLTNLGIVLEEDLVDPIRQLMTFHLGQESTARRVTLTANDVPQDLSGLKLLLENKCYHAAVNLTGRLLVLLGQGVAKASPTKITPQIIQIWFVRIALLVKLRQFAIAEVEAAPFSTCDQPDLFYEFYPDIYGPRKGSMVPFAFRVLLSELRLHLGHFSEALDRLYSILTTVEEILSNLKAGFREDGTDLEMAEKDRKDSVMLWEERKTKVSFSVLNCLLAMKDYNAAVTVGHSLVNDDPQCPHLKSLLGRIFLQLGDVNGAKENFNQAIKLMGSSRKDKTNELVNSGLIAVAQSEFENAYSKFKEAVELDPGNPLIINNMGVCLLYMGRLKDALKILEGPIHQKPTQFLHEGILFNVCTLYELESSRSTERKQAMLNMVGTHCSDAFNATCLKLPLPT